MDLEDQSNGSSSSACQTNTDNGQAKGGNKRKLIYQEHFEDIINSITKKIEKAKCKYCGKVLSANPNNRTPTLRKNLHSCSKYPYNVDKKQKKISLFRDPQTKSVTISNWTFDVEVTRLDLAKMIVIDEHPFFYG